MNPDLKPVEIGIMYFTDTNKFAASFGSSADFGDPLIQSSTVVNYLNAHGGLAGHKIVPVEYGVSLTSSQNYVDELQAMCDNWTQDHHVIGAITVGNNGPTIQSCLNEHKVVSTQAALYLHSQQDYASWPFMANPSELNVTTGATAYVDGLFQQGFFGKNDKIGVFYNDYAATSSAYKNALVPALARHGIKVTDAFTVHYPDSTPGIANSIQGLQTPVLQMASDGVTRVLFLCTACESSVMSYAASNKWNPRYGLSSYSVAYSLAANAAKGQMDGAQGVGWLPFNDVANADAPPPNATAKLCLDIMKPTGQATTQANQIGAYSYCEGLFLYQAAAAAADPAAVLTGDGLRNGVDRLGSRYLSALTAGTTLSTTQRDGAIVGRSFAFVGTCSCIKYTSKPYPLR